MELWTEELKKRFWLTPSEEEKEKMITPTFDQAHKMLEEGQITLNELRQLMGLPVLQPFQLADMRMMATYDRHLALTTAKYDAHLVQDND